MSAGGRLIERYIVGAIIPYLLLALLLLTAVLFAQQAGRFAELLVSAHIPPDLLAKIVSALLPNVLIFTLPMAVLSGTIIGLSRMGSDSELVALRAAGVGTWALLWPILAIGLMASTATFYLNLEEAPGAARALRRASLRAALYKLDSPVEPRSFSTEIPGYVVYVRDGDKAAGTWGRVFIYSREADGGTRLITARSGRIDSDRAGGQSELVLSDAVATKLPTRAEREHPYVLERLAQLRIQFNTGRAALLARLQSDQAEADEMGWHALRAYAASSAGAGRRDAATLAHKRLSQAVAPLVFALLGGALGLRIRKGGRGLGAVLALSAMITYYLISLIGEQMARAGSLAPPVGAWLATGAAAAASLLMLSLRHGGLIGRLKRPSLTAPASLASGSGGRALLRAGAARTTGLPSFYSLLDISVSRALTLSFTFAFTSLTAIFLIFTLFELWRFIVANSAGARLVVQYLTFLLPLASVELLPASVLMAVLGTYALMARRSEAIAWWACGQSAYRLMIPGFAFAAVIGGGLWLIQERLMPQANSRQDALRAQIRGGGARVATGTGPLWFASAGTGRIYAYEYDEERGVLKDPTVYILDREAVHLQAIIKGDEGDWVGSDRMELSRAQFVDFRTAQIQQRSQERIWLDKVEPRGVFKPAIDKPSQLSASGLSDYIKNIKQRGGSVTTLSVALQRKYAEPFSVLVMGLIGMPLALAFGRRSAIVALCSAVAVGVGFWGVIGGFQQLGVYGLLPPPVAVWAPMVIFAATGTYLLARTRS